MSVIDEIAAERRRQMEVEGWSAEHDDEHKRGEMARAAACYAYANGFPDYGRSAYSANPPPMIWPWDKKWWKPKTPRRDLIRAAALIVAEIERLDRVSPNTCVQRQPARAAQRSGAPAKPVSAATHS